MLTASFTADVHLFDAADMLKHVQGRDPSFDDGDGLEELVERALVSPRRPPLDAGYELMKIDVSRTGEDRFQLHVAASITDAAAFLAETEASYKASWSESFEPENLGHALYETVLASNDAPSPVEIGFEIMSSSYRGDAIPTASPSP